LHVHSVPPAPPTPPPAAPPGGRPPPPPPTQHTSPNATRRGLNALESQNLAWELFFNPMLAKCPETQSMNLDLAAQALTECF
ncbi:MAG: hypothetical protein LBC87_06595, partial [Fibromonadaceae bacterium]|nr:hypothetical protein [Fibromonadaceae bacterium]